mgnify:CR=1 FL=1
MGRKGHCREYILDAGSAVLLQKGYNGTGVKDIVDAASVPKGSFYNHFESKQAFVIEAIEKISQQHNDEAKVILTKKGVSPKQRFFSFFDTVHSQMKANDFNGGCILGNLCLEMADENTAIREAVERLMCQQIRLWRDNLNAAKESGELKAGFEPAELAEFLHFAWEGAIMKMKSCRVCQPYSTFRNQLEKFFN